MAKQRGSGARAQATRRKKVKEVKAAYKTYVSKKMSESSAFGTFPKNDTPEKAAKRVRARRAARQAQVRPKKIRVSGSDKPKKSQ